MQNISIEIPPHRSAGVNHIFRDAHSNHLFNHMHYQHVAQKWHFFLPSQSKSWRTACADGYTTRYNIESKNMRESMICWRLKKPGFCSLADSDLGFSSLQLLHVISRVLCPWGKPSFNLMNLQSIWNVLDLFKVKLKSSVKLLRKHWFYFQQLFSDRGVPVVTPANTPETFLHFISFIFWSEGLGFGTNISNIPVSHFARLWPN